ncbi:MAG: YhgE/Pip domain-containing protein [Liquorilactobacillus hordei]|uniref:YhgE/Pip family protein n=1 Tax=Liquorilactobacillus hordei TaxID=468911 RepID=UPI0039EA76B8
MIKEEFKNILNHKLLIATILAIMFIPFLYSVFFLKSVWDPYGNAGSLPVAVVNEDKAVSYNGKKMQVGDKLVKELKKNDSLQWHFVSAKKALDGMKHKKYYTIITIPKNFSKNATTVLNKNPKKMRLTYKTNDSLNYIGKVISEEGAKQLNTKINATVTKAYAKTMFATIKQVGTGFTTASKGANKLEEGSTTLSDGLNTYTAGVKKVSDGVIELQTGVVPLSQGVIKLTTGATALQSGVSEYTAGVAKVNTGTQKLNNSTGTLASGVSKLATGSNSLSSGLGTYTSGVSSLNSGLATLNASSSTINNSLASLSSLPQASAGLYVLNSVVSNGLNQINVSQFNDMVQGMTSVQGQMVSINSLMNELKPTLDELNQMQSEFDTINTQLDSVMSAKKAFTDTLSNDLTKIGTNSKTSATNAMEVLTYLKSSGNTDENTQKMENMLQEIVSVNQDNGTQISDIESKADAFDKSMNSVTTQLNTLKTSISSLSSATEKLNTLMEKSKALMDSSDSLTNQQAQEKIKQLLSGVTQLQTIATKSANISKQLNASVNTSKASSLLDLDSISQASSNGSANTTSIINSQVSKMAANSQLPTLIAGIQKYTAGVQTAYNGANKLADNNSSLTSGASQLATGLGTLNGNVPTLVSGVSQLASGTSELNSNSAALNSGTAQLASGLTQLNSKVPTLSSGVNQLASGTSQLNANSSKLTQGSAKLSDGNKALAKALGKGAKKVNAVKTSNKTANMFATPSKLTHKNYSTVPNYGYALAPYMLSVALYVGALVFNLVYPIRRLSTPDGTGTEWFLSKIAVGAVVATGTAVIETLLMMAVGLTPDHPFQMILNALVFSFTAMYLIMFLSVAGGNPGRFAAMILLVIQLGGSGGSFPIDITNGMNGFFQAINPFLPMTYSILGFREALTSGLGSNQVLFSVGIMLIFMIASLLLLWATMVTKRKNGSVSYAEPATEEK